MKLDKSNLDTIKMIEEVIVGDRNCMPITENQAVGIIADLEGVLSENVRDLANEVRREEIDRRKTSQIEERIERTGAVMYFLRNAKLNRFCPIGSKIRFMSR